MIKLKIISQDNYTYKLEDEKNNKYDLNLEFFDIETTPKVGDYIHISAELLNTKYAGYSTSYTFGKLENEYGKRNISLTDIDVIKVVANNLEIYLKRLYG